MARKSSLRKRMTITAPAAVVGSKTSWSSHLLAILFFMAACAGAAFWGFEKGKEAVGMDNSTQKELSQLRDTVAELEKELNSAQTIVNTSDSRLTTERAVQTRLQEKVDSLTTENSRLRSDLGFYENLIPSENANKVEIRGLQVTPGTAQAADGSRQQLYWQVLLMHPQKSAGQTSGTLELSYTYEDSGKEKTVRAHRIPVKFRQHKRFDGTLELPPEHTLIRKFGVALKRGNALLAKQSIPLG